MAAPPPHDRLTPLRQRLLAGQVIPAHPLALTPDGAFDERHQRALTRYYHAAGAGGLAVGVHTTQFEIRRPEVGLLEPVLSLAAETARALDDDTHRSTVLVAGVCGATSQAVKEAGLAARLGYDAGLLALPAVEGGAFLTDTSLERLLAHCRAVAAEIPLFGFYLQPAVGGRDLPIDFWRELLRLPRLVAIKVAPFDRYRTLEVARAVGESGRAEEVALYTGNDDHILLDLLTEVANPAGPARVSFAGGLLGQWAVWTRTAVDHLERCRKERRDGRVSAETLTLAAQLTEANAAIFDAAHRFVGSVPGVHEVLRRQGLLASRRCLDPGLDLSPGQEAEIDRVQARYPHLTDDDFVARRLEGWLAD